MGYTGIDNESHAISVGGIHAGSDTRPTPVGLHAVDFLECYELLGGLTHAHAGFHATLEIHHCDRCGQSAIRYVALELWTCIQRRVARSLRETSVARHRLVDGSKMVIPITKTPEAYPGGGRIGSTRRRLPPTPIRV